MSDFNEGTHELRNCQLYVDEGVNISAHSNLMASKLTDSLLGILIDGQLLIHEGHGN